MTSNDPDRGSPFLAPLHHAAVALAAVGALAAAQSPAPIVFTDVAQRAGIGFVHHNGATGSYWYPELFGGGVAVLDIDGDGSFLMNIQELACCYTEKIAPKVLLLNNQHLGMVVQWEDRFFGSNRGHTFGDELTEDERRAVVEYLKTL